MDRFSFFVLNICLNSLLAFLTTFLLLETVRGLFRIRQGRLSSYLRMIPILKLPFDLFLYDFSHWSYAQGIDPLKCEEGTRNLSCSVGWLDSGIQMSLPGDLTFTVADLAGYILPLSILRGFAILFTSVTALIFIKRLFDYFIAARQLRGLKTVRRVTGKKIHNPKLIPLIKKRISNIVVSPDLQGSPFVSGLFSCSIFIPESLSMMLTRKEYEAALAHEMEHIRHKDGLVRLMLALICSIFWWVPAKWLRKRIEEGQEMGCDLQCEKYGVHSLDLASAISKSARQIHRNGSYPFAWHLVGRQTVHRRVKALLADRFASLKKTRLILAACAAGAAFFVIFLGRYWIF